MNASTCTEAIYRNVSERDCDLLKSKWKPKSDDHPERIYIKVTDSHYEIGNNPFLFYFGEYAKHIENKCMIVRHDKASDFLLPIQGSQIFSMYMLHVAHVRITS